MTQVNLRRPRSGGCRGGVCGSAHTYTEFARSICGLRRGCFGVSSINSKTYTLVLRVVLSWDGLPDFVGWVYPILSLSVGAKSSAWKTCFDLVVL